MFVLLVSNAMSTQLFSAIIFSSLVFHFLGCFILSCRTIYYLFLFPSTIPVIQKYKKMRRLSKNHLCFKSRILTKKVLTTCKSSLQTKIGIVKDSKDANCTSGKSLNLVRGIFFCKFIRNTSLLILNWASTDFGCGTNS